MSAPVLSPTRTGPSRGSRRRKGRQGSNLVVEMAARMGRDSIFYTMVTGAIFPLGLLNAVILTSYLTTSQYGRLAVLFVISGLTSVVLNLLFLRGVERQVWGSSDEGVDVGLAELVGSSQRPRPLGTGIVLSAIIATLAILAVVPFATPLSRLLLHSRHEGAAIIWLAASAGFGSVWRLVSNIARWERRHTPFAMVYTLRTTLAIAIAWPLVASGAGVTGAVAATAIATLVSVAYGLVVTRHSYVLVLDRHAGVSIARSSANFAAMVIGLYVLHNGDVVLLSRVANSAQAGIYNLATNITSAVSYGVSAFLMAWSPLEWSSLFQAAYEEQGRERMRSAFLTYYLVVGVFLVLILTAVATPLIGLFSASYGKAGGFVGITGAGYLAYGLFLVIARTSSFPWRYVIYGFAALISAGALIATSLVLGPSLGGYGVASADIVGGLAGTAVILLFAAVAGVLPPVDVRRVSTLLVIGGACWAIGAPLAKLAGELSPLLKLASVALFPVLLIVTRVIPASDLSQVWAVLQRTMHSRARPEVLLERIATLPGTERRILIMIARDGEPTSRVVALTGIPDATVRVRLVSALRRLSQSKPPDQHDLAIADFLLADVGVTERDGMGRELQKQGVEPTEMHDIEAAFRTLCSASAKDWSASVVGPGPDLPLGPWPVDATALELLDEVARRGAQPGEAAERLGIEPGEAPRRLVGALRSLSTGGAAQPADGLIASFLFNRPVAPPARQLWAAGVDPFELHQLERALDAIRSLPAEHWSEITASEPVVAQELEELEVLEEARS